METDEYSSGYEDIYFEQQVRDYERNTNDYDKKMAQANQRASKVNPASDDELYGAPIGSYVDLTKTSSDEESEPPRSASKKRKAPPKTPTRSNEGPKSRAWCFTWNNPTETGDDFNARLETTPGIRYAVFQLEQGENGTPHFQGYCYFNGSGKTLKTLINQIGQMHWSPARTVAEHNTRYCTKCCDECYLAKRSGTCGATKRLGGPWTFGEPPTQGRRNDLAGVVRRLKEGATRAEVIDEFPDVVMKYPKNVDYVRKLVQKGSGDYPRTARLSIGPTRFGKTWDATRAPGTNSFDEDCWMKKDTKWFDTYSGETKVVWDDFAGAASAVSLTSLLQLLDNYRHLGETKGGWEWWLAKEIWFTSNIHPFLWYEWKNRRAQLDALAARFTEVRIYTGPGKYNPLRGADEIKDFFTDPVKYGYSDVRET